ncbi:hypothetical protein TcWFU_001997 [Taenia crassiceps]|uniref:Uncharacterized protein n=1 Tax=Taenia crassiceps TaxID=6207 RepID=A0ABR4Q499_9CEST
MKCVHVFAHNRILRRAPLSNAVDICPSGGSGKEESSQRQAKSTAGRGGNEETSEMEVKWCGHNRRCIYSRVSPACTPAYEKCARLVRSRGGW